MNKTRDSHKQWMQLLGMFNFITPQNLIAKEEKDNHAKIYITKKN